MRRVAATTVATKSPIGNAAHTPSPGKHAERRRTRARATAIPSKFGATMSLKLPPVAVDSGRGDCAAPADCGFLRQTTPSLDCGSTQNERHSMADMRGAHKE